MSHFLINNLDSLTNLPLDAKYYNSNNSPYANKDAVIKNIDKEYRYKGLTVNIDGQEFWFEKGIEDSDLVIKNRSIEVATQTPENNGLHKLDGKVIVLKPGANFINLNLRGKEHITENCSFSILKTFDDVVYITVDGVDRVGPDRLNGKKGSTAMIIYCDRTFYITVNELS